MKPHPQATTSRAVHPFAPSPGLSFSARKEVGGRPYSRLDPGLCALSLGRSPVALGNHKTPHDGSRRPRWSSASHSSRTALLLTTARLYLSTSTRPSSRLHSRLGPSSQPQQQGPLYKPLWLPALPLATHMRSELPAGQRSECACLKGGLIKAQRRSWKGNLKGVCATGRRAIGRNERGTVRLL